MPRWSPAAMATASSAATNEPSIFTLFGQGFETAQDASGADNMHRAIHHVNLAHGAPSTRCAPACRAVDRLHPQFQFACRRPIRKPPRLRCLLNRVYPDPQCHGAHPKLLRAAIEPHMQPGDWRALPSARLVRSQSLWPDLFQSRRQRALRFGFGERPADLTLTPTAGHGPAGVPRHSADRRPRLRPADLCDRKRDGRP